MAGRYCCRDVLPFTSLVAMECVNVGLNTLYKAATLQGMNYYVFIVYAYAIAALVLLPAPFISCRSRVLPPLSFSILCKIGLLGLIGSSSQIMGFTGINYSSPTLSSAISNLTPAFTFILAIIFGMERVAMKRRSSQAKVLGTIISIAGAFVVTLYKGPPIIIASSPSISLDQSLQSPHPNWILGGIFLTAEYILVPLWYIVQGLLGSCLNNTVHTWALHLKGPVFVAMFKPLSIAIAVAMGAMFLCDTLHLGSLIGAMIISGFYTVMWGKAKEELSEDYGVSTLESHPPRRFLYCKATKMNLCRANKK
ncbi:hypothetical protein GH714_010931 [Hevea brasiliensis]|uniref:WAT1-related protein n=1 Tax=Hevea brasiliensis TaxID=3981 RepID=A0A6A6M831_HEVBR|nr:hypothetical protein GH714_010931 [Hevea brasiliensis]